MVQRSELEELREIAEWNAEHGPGSTAIAAAARYLDAVGQLRAYAIRHTNITFMEDDPLIGREAWNGAFALLLQACDGAQNLRHELDVCPVETVAETKYSEGWSSGFREGFRQGTAERERVFDPPVATACPQCGTTDNLRNLAYGVPYVEEIDRVEVRPGGGATVYTYGGETGDGDVDVPTTIMCNCGGLFTAPDNWDRELEY